MSTPRERREQRAAEERRKQMPAEIAKKAIWPVIGVLLVGGVVAAVYFSEQAAEGCPGHWHATMGVFIEEERLTFPQPPYNLDQEPPGGGRLPLSMHLHRGNQELLHFEPGTPRCRGVESTMELVDVGLASGRLTLSGEHESGPLGGTYEDNETHKVRVHIQMAGEERREESIRDSLGYQLQDGEKLVISYGNHTDEQIQALLEQLEWPSGFDANGRL